MLPTSLCVLCMGMWCVRVGVVNLGGDGGSKKFNKSKASNYHIPKGSQSFGPPLPITQIPMYIQTSLKYLRLLVKQFGILAVAIKAFLSLRDFCHRNQIFDLLGDPQGSTFSRAIKLGGLY